LTQQPTRFSIVIPTLNAAKTIGACLESLLSQNYPDRFEVLVVDGLSKDGTPEIVSRYLHDSRVRLLCNPGKITPKAFNIGVKAARGEVIMTVGAHWRLPPDFLCAIERAFANFPEASCLGGRIIREVGSRQGEAIECARRSLLGGGLSLRNYCQQEMLVDVDNIAYIWRRKVFEAVGLFDETLAKNQDNEFNMRTRKAGFKTLYSPNVYFYYRAPDTYRRLFKQMYGYARYTPLIIAKHGPTRIHFALPTLMLLIWLPSFGFALLGTWSLLPFAGLTIAYLLGLTLFAVLSAIRDRLSCVHLVLAAYVIIHLAVALGFADGVVDWAAAGRYQKRARSTIGQAGSPGQPKISPGERNLHERSLKIRPTDETIP